jgi:hypothetical protein
MRIGKVKIDEKKLRKLYQVGEYWAVLLAFVSLIFNELLLFAGSTAIATYCAVKRYHIRETD